MNEALSPGALRQKVLLGSVLYMTGAMVGVARMDGAIPALAVPAFAALACFCVIGPVPCRAPVSLRTAFSLSPRCPSQSHERC